MDECAWFMPGITNWKCLLSTSRMECAAPHRKNKEVMSTKGSIYCRLTNAFKTFKGWVVKGWLCVEMTFPY